MHLVKGSDNLHFFYDAQGRPAVVDFNGTKYGYVHNLQGDIIAIVDGSGNQVVEYTFDAWGKPLPTTGTLATTLGTLNPFRYRGYVYDEETSLYYLRSRYYNPTWGRFLNGDCHFDDNAGLFGKNLYTYCANSPINGHDPDGTDFLSNLGTTLYNWFLKSYEDRYEAMRDDPSFYNIGNWITSGVFDTVKAAVAPEKQLSLDHWIDSFTVVLYCTPLMQWTSKTIPVKVPRGNPLANVTYADSIYTRMINSPANKYHNFPFLIDSMGSAGYSKVSIGGDGMIYNYFRMNGSYNGIDGVFEYYIRNNEVTHRLFVKFPK